MACLKMILTTVVMCMLMASPAAKAAITCSDVVEQLEPCISYLQTPGTDAPPDACCDGVRTLNGTAQTTPDRQAACICMQSSAKSIGGLNFDTAATLPAKCGVSIPYEISPSTDCSKVQ